MGVWDTPPTANELKGSDPWAAPPTAAEKGAPEKPFVPPDPLAGMSTMDKVLAGIGHGMTVVGRNAADIAAESVPNRIPGKPAKQGHYSSEDWKEFNRVSAPLVSSGPTPDINRLRGLGGSMTAGGLGSQIGEGVATLPIAGLVGAPLRGLVGPGASLLPRTLASGAAGATEGATVGALTATDPTQRARQVLGGLVAGGAAGTALPLAGAALRPAAEVASTGLRSYAEKAAVKSANADRTATKRVFGRPLNDAARSETGAYLLDQGIPLRSPAAMQDALAEKLATEGPEIKNLVTQATGSGAKLDLPTVKARVLADPDIQALKNNTETRPIFGRVEAFLDDQIDQHPNGMDPVAAHSLRSKTLDNLAAWDRQASKVDQTAAGAFRTVRGALSDELGATMDRAGLGDEWNAANAGYKNAARAKQLADVGAERRTGNRLGSPSEKAAGLLGGAALALHNPVAGIALPAATVALNRGFFPVTARTANALSRVLTPATEAATGPQASQAAALIAALRRHGIPGLAPAVAEEGEQ